MKRLLLTVLNYRWVFIGCLLILMASLVLSDDDSSYISTGFFSYYDDVTLSRSAIIEREETVELSSGLVIRPFAITDDGSVLFYSPDGSIRCSLPADYFYEKEELSDYLNASRREAYSAIRKVYIRTVVEGLFICSVIVISYCLLSRYCKNKNIIKVYNTLLVIGSVIVMLIAVCVSLSSR